MKRNWERAVWKILILDKPRKNKLSTLCKDRDIKLIYDRENTKTTLK